MYLFTCMCVSLYIYINSHLHLYLYNCNYSYISSVSKPFWDPPWRVLWGLALSGSGLKCHVKRKYQKSRKRWTPWSLISISSWMWLLTWQLSSEIELGCPCEAKRTGREALRGQVGEAMGSQVQLSCPRRWSRSLLMTILLTPHSLEPRWGG